MLFPTVDFALFFVVVFTGHWVLRPRPVPWRLFILAASLFFYGYWDWGFVPLIGASIVGNWVMASWAARTLHDGQPTRGTRLAVALAVVGNLAVLGWFKYAGFFATSVANTARQLGFELGPSTLDVVLPVGISFFTFQALSYVIDVARGELEPVDLLEFGVYLSFFPQLVAGPIVRASEMVPQMRAPSDPRHVRSAEGFRLIAAGLFKKVVIANYLGSQIVDPVFALPSQHSSAEVLLAVYAYAIQIYADFSGYTDIAIGCALLLGFRFPQNFDAPYVATSLQEFWRRWHMTLSRWLRDYLYVPLGGNRGGERRTERNLLITMLLGGLWHGAAWNFVIWGAIHGGGLALERRVKMAWRPLGLPTPLVRVLQWFLTFHLVCLAWVFFRAESFGLARELLGRLVVGGTASGVLTSVVVGTILAMLMIQFIPADARRVARRMFASMPLAVQGLGLALVLLIIDTFGPVGVAPFIYFQF